MGGTQHMSAEIWFQGGLLLKQKSSRQANSKRFGVLAKLWFQVERVE